MAKLAEINYIKQVAAVENVPIDSFRDYLRGKPFSDTRCGEYLMDIAQIFKILPQPPARLLDVGVGSGWTTELFAMRGYEALGLDISPDMIELANERGGKAKFAVCDYEIGPLPAGFDVAVIYDALHHAENEFAVLQNICGALNNGGILVTIEPGVGHSKAPESLEVMRKYGTTEKDMPFSHQNELLRQAGFGTVERYVRLSQIPTENVASLNGAIRQMKHGLALGCGLVAGLTSVVVARKSESSAHTEKGETGTADKLIPTSIASDRFQQDLEIRPD